jgi:hypothetical protein
MTKIPFIKLLLKKKQLKKVVKKSKIINKSKL